MHEIEFGRTYPVPADFALQLEPARLTDIDPAHVLDPHGDVVLRTHYHDNDGLPDQLEVVAAPTQAAVDLHLLRRWPVGRTSLIYNGDTLVFGTPGLGRGRVAYQIYAWDAQERALRVVRLPDVPDGWYEEHCEPKPDAPLPPASDEPREHPGTGRVMHGTEAPADGTEVELVSHAPGCYLMPDGCTCGALRLPVRRADRGGLRRGLRERARR